MAQPVHSVRQVTCAKADASAAEEAAHVLTSAGSGSQLLHGILHAGAVLDSKVMTNVNATTIRTEFAGACCHSTHLRHGRAGLTPRVSSYLQGCLVFYGGVLPCDLWRCPAGQTADVFLFKSIPLPQARYMAPSTCCQGA